MNVTMASFANRTAPAAPAAPPRSKYGGIKSAESRDPMLGLGTYRVRVVSCVEGKNPGTMRESYKVSLQVLRAADSAETPVGSTCTMVTMFTAPGMGELKRFAFHAAGFGPTLEQRAADVADARSAAIAGEAEYDKLDEAHGYQGAILEASAGHANGAPSLVGRVVDVIVARGKDVMNPQTRAPTGDFYRQYTWGVVPDEEQDG